MKRRSIYSLLPLAALLLNGCTADLSGESPSAGDGFVPFSLTTSVVGQRDAAPHAATRTATDVQSTQFDAGETFYAYFPSGVRIGTEAGTSTTFTTTDANGTTTPATQPYFAQGVSTVRVHAYYPSSVTQTTAAFSVQLDQTAASGYKASDLMYATTEVTVNKAAAASATGNLTFSHKMSKLIVTATAGQGISKIQKVRVVGGYKTINIAAATTTNEATTAYLGTTLTNAITTTDDGCLKLYEDATGAATVSCAALIPPQRIPATGSTATPFLQVVTDQGTATYSLTGKDFESGDAYTYSITVSLAAIGTVTNITDWTGAGSDLLWDTGTETLGTQKAEDIPEGAEAVDLGLSVKWANMNIGATAETDYGTYFAWGETNGYTVVGATTTAAEGNTKDTFDWTTYSWSNSDGSKFTKYVPTAQTSYWGGGGDPDNKLQLELSDDAAYNAWGGNWRMPTQAEMQELLTLEKAWVDDYNSTGVSGYTLTGNGNTIFLPAAGYHGGTSFSYQGSNGVYWSSTLHSSLPIIAWNLGFYSGTAYMNSTSRYYGFTVRAVRDD